MIKKRSREAAYLAYLVQLELTQQMAEQVNEALDSIKSKKKNVQDN